MSDSKDSPVTLQTLCTDTSNLMVPSSGSTPLVSNMTKTETSYCASLRQKLSTFIGKLEDHSSVVSSDVLKKVASTVHDKPSVVPSSSPTHLNADISDTM